MLTSTSLRPLLAAALCLSADAALACADRDAAIAAINGGDLDGSKAFYERVAVDPECDDAFRQWLGEGVARQISASSQAATYPATKEAILTESLRYAAHWRTYVALADIALARGDHTREANLLQQAINQMNDGPEHHSVSREEVDAIMARTSAAMALAEEPVILTRTRSGDIGGVFAKNVRGFTVSEVAVPVYFEFDSNVMTPEGEAYAKQLLESVLTDNPPSITLEGHTDPQGDAAYNMALSERRANAVKEMLEAGGYTGVITVVPRGESEQPAAHPPGTENTEQHYQVARRVVLER